MSVSAAAYCVTSAGGRPRSTAAKKTACLAKSAGASSCLSCLGGTYSGGGATACANCLAGMYSPAGGKHVVKLLVGNKIDQERVVSREVSTTEWSWCSWLVITGVLLIALLTL